MNSKLLTVCPSPSVAAFNEKQTFHFSPEYLRFAAGLVRYRVEVEYILNVTAAAANVFERFIIGHILSVIKERQCIFNNAS
jgi:hypothetical protein